MKVIKFGGTSVGSSENIQKVANIISKQAKKDPDISVVVSAFTGVTNQLIKISELAQKREYTYIKLMSDCEKRHYRILKELIPNPSDEMFKHLQNEFEELNDVLHGVYLLKELTGRSSDLILGFGERLSAYIISRFLDSSGIPSQFTDTRKLIVTDDSHGHANIDYQKSARKIRRYYTNYPGIKIVTGFIAATSSGISTTLGRGGSDLTASFLGAVLKADEIQIWTDVDGVMSADPGKVPDAFCLKTLSYEEAMELSHFGAKVLHPPTIQPALEKGIPIRILNTFNPDFEGTLVQKEFTSNGYPAKGITSISNVSLLTIQGSGMVGVTGISARAFTTLAKYGISIILISQASSEHSICLAVKPESALSAKKAIEKEFLLEIKTHIVDKVMVENNLSVVALVGESMRKTPGISGRLFHALAERNVNVVAIAQGSSELNISVVVDQNDEKTALRAIHDAFFFCAERINLIVCGTGLIGREFLHQLSENQTQILENKNLNLQLIGIANIDNAVFNPGGISFSDWETLLVSGDKNPEPDYFLKKIKHLPGGKSIFVDITASPEISQTYTEFFKAGVSVIAANKMANTGDYEAFKTLRKTCRDHAVFFRYETNVGAGLPIIRTLKSLLDTGDRILKIEAVLSGTISYIFNSFKTGGIPFSRVIHEAQEKGFTEPDPRNDLNGLDFARKLLLLMRECGEGVNLTDIHVEPILPKDCFSAHSLEDFYTTLETHDHDFHKLLYETAQSGKVLRYMGTYENGKGRIELKKLPADHPFSGLKGSDNCIVITTERYHENPLVIQGPGAGAKVTAAGLVSDLISE
jgi:aspartokinase/homoserine dehydrogenase 1